MKTKRIKIDKRISHLTYDRPELHRWPIGEMVRKGLEMCLDYMTEAFAMWDQTGETRPNGWEQLLNRTGLLGGS